MAEENSKGKKSMTDRFLDFIKKVMGILENIPKALTGLLLIVSLVAGGTGFYGTVTKKEAPEKAAVIAEHTEIESHFQSVENRVLVLETENKLLNELVIRLLSAQGMLKEDIELKSFIIDVETGKVTPISN